MLSTLDPIKLIEPGVLPAGQFRVFSLHVDFAAGLRARWAASLMAKLAGAQWICSSEQWKLDSLLTAQAVRQMITGEANRADILLVAVSSLKHRELELIHWLDSLTPRMANPLTPGLLIGLFGDETNRAEELDWTVKHCMNSARQTNRDFIWHWMEEPAAGEPEWLTSHLETFLARKFSAQDQYHPAETILEFA